MLTSEMLSKLSTWTSMPTGIAEPAEKTTKVFQVWDMRSRGIWRDSKAVLLSPVWNVMCLKWQKQMHCLKGCCLRKCMLVSDV